MLCIHPVKSPLEEGASLHQDGKVQSHFSLEVKTFPATLQPVTIESQATASSDTEGTSPTGSLSGFHSWAGA